MYEGGVSSASEPSQASRFRVYYGVSMWSMQFRGNPGALRINNGSKVVGWCEESY